MVRALVATLVLSEDAVSVRGMEAGLPEIRGIAVLGGVSQAGLDLWALADPGAADAVVLDVGVAGICHVPESPVLGSTSVTSPPHLRAADGACRRLPNEGRSLFGSPHTLLIGSAPIVLNQRLDPVEVPVLNLGGAASGNPAPGRGPTGWAESAQLSACRDRHSPMRPTRFVESGLR